MLIYIDIGMKYLLIIDENDIFLRKRLNEKVKMIFGVVGYKFESNVLLCFGWSIINMFSIIVKCVCGFKFKGFCWIFILMLND